MSEQSGADPMNEQTPANTIYRLLFDWSLPPQQVTDDILAALDAAGFRVSSKPDDDTRQRVTPLVVAVDRFINRWAESDDAVRTELWQAMAKASADLADATGVYPL